MAVNQNPGPVGQVPEFLGVMDLDSPKYGNNDGFHVKHIEFSSWDSIPQTWSRTTARPHLTNYPDSFKLSPGMFTEFLPQAHRLQ